MPMVKLWGGFVDGKLATSMINDGFGGVHYREVPALFTTKKEAREQYQDVRPCEVDFPVPQ